MEGLWVTRAWLSWKT